MLIGVVLLYSKKIIGYITFLFAEQDASFLDERWLAEKIDNFLDNLGVIRGEPS